MNELEKYMPNFESRLDLTELQDKMESVKREVKK